MGPSWAMTRALGAAGPHKAPPSSRGGWGLWSCWWPRCCLSNHGPQEQKGGIFIQSPTVRAFGKPSEGTLWAKAPSCGSEPPWRLLGARAGSSGRRLSLPRCLLALFSPSVKHRAWPWCTSTCAPTGVFRQPLPPAGLGGGWGWKGICSDLRGLGRTDRPPVSRYEQVPCLSRPAPTSSLGHLEEGSLARWQRWRRRFDVALGPPRPSDWGEGERGHPPSLSSALSQLIMGLIRSHSS